MENDLGIKSYSSDIEQTIDSIFIEQLKNCPIPQTQLLENLGLFLKSKNLSRILFLDFIYKKILETQGVIFDFGTRWGNNMAVFTALRGIYEPFNRHRKIIGFDTFTGFPDISIQDGKSELMKKGNIKTTENYEKELEKIIALHESGDPLSHIKRFEIIKGNAIETVPQYLNDNSQTIIALAYFDFDIYKPTKVCLEQIEKRLTKGSILVFDELNDSDSPGETIAVKQILGLNNIKLKRYPYTSRVSYCVIGE